MRNVLELPLGMTPAAAEKYGEKLVGFVAKLESLIPTLAYLAARLQKVHDWSVEQTDSAIRDYLRFLSVARLTGEELAPSAEVDEVWHEHLMFTREYAAFCDELFGGFLHHTPSSDGPNDAAFARTKDGIKALYNETWVKAGCCCCCGCQPL